MIKFSPGAIPKEVGDQICALNESRYHSRPRSAAGALWHNKCITFKKSGGKKVCPSWLARCTVTRWPGGETRPSSTLPSEEKWDLRVTLSHNQPEVSKTIVVLSYIIAARLFVKLPALLTANHHCMPRGIIITETRVIKPRTMLIKVELFVRVNSVSAINFVSHLCVCSVRERAREGYVVSRNNLL